ncbi:hypothetical protein [Amycolatopsis sp. GM8]|uniref:hypothetical protein n=1 Tax=Amycolatopsis sp. GM8 TaxID=2896530 RepID=UPI001F312FD1|nr:hypothetical protein [Amycolatopsis sp. GM8]
MRGTQGDHELADQDLPVRLRDLAPVPDQLAGMHLDSRVANSAQIPRVVVEPGTRARRVEGDVE